MSKEDLDVRFHNRLSTRQESFYRRKRSAGILGVTVLLFLASPATAQTIWRVDDNAPNDPGPGTPNVSDPLEDGSAEHPFDAIQEGIDAASDGDTVLVLSGTYRGAGNKNMSFLGKEITVRAAVSQESVVDCEGDGYAFAFSANETAESLLIGFFITGGHPANPFGGVISIRYAAPLIIDCTVADSGRKAILASHGECNLFGCTVKDILGDGVYCERSTATLYHCTFTGIRRCGISCSDGTTVIRNCVVEDNDATDRYGNAIFINTGSVTWISDCIVRRNTADLYSAILVGEGMVVIERCEVSQNVTNEEYAGYAAGISIGGHPAIIRDSRITGNHGSLFGGGIFTGWTDISILNCLIADNVSTEFGGGIYVGEEAQACVTNCTIARNTSNVGGAICLLEECDLTVSNTILWHDEADIGSEITLGSPCELSISFCDIEGGTDGIEAGSAGQLRWGPGNIDADPLFADALNGDYRMLPGSPGIDAGSNCAVLAHAADLDLSERFADDPDTPDTGAGLAPIVDLGAFEYGEASPPPCEGDLDGNGMIGLGDLASLLGHFGQTTGATGAQGDMDCDFDVDLDDLAALLSLYGQTCD